MFNTVSTRRFCAPESSSICSPAASSARGLIKIVHILIVVIWSCLAVAQQQGKPIALSKDSRSAHTSELFSKVLELEERMRELNGKLQHVEHQQQALHNKLNEIMRVKEETAKANAEIKPSTTDQGEILYKQGLAHVNNKMYEKAAEYFAKSYRYYSEVKSNDVLFKLIEVLSLEKKYEQACTLVKRISDKHLKPEQKTFLANLNTSNCQNKSQH